MYSSILLINCIFASRDAFLSTAKQMPCNVFLIWESNKQNKTVTPKRFFHTLLQMAWKSLRDKTVMSVDKRIFVSVFTHKSWKSNLTVSCWLIRRGWGVCQILCKCVFAAVGLTERDHLGTAAWLVFETVWKLNNFLWYFLKCVFF